MKHLPLCLLLLTTPALAGDDGALGSWGKEYFDTITTRPVKTITLNEYGEVDHDYGSFYQTKVALKDALFKAVNKYQLPETADQAFLNRLVQDIQLKVLTLKAAGAPLDYTLYGSIIDPNLMLITLVVKYADNVSEIEWEFETIVGNYSAAFYSRTSNGTKATSTDDYYRWALLLPK